MLPSKSSVSYVSPTSIFPITVSSRWETTKPIPWSTGISYFIYLFKQQQNPNKIKTNQTTEKTKQTTPNHTFIQNNLPITK